MDTSRWTRIAIGLAFGALVGIGLYTTGQVWPLAAAIGFIVADLVYAGLTLAQTGDWGAMRVSAGLVAFAIATYVGIISFGDFTDANAVPRPFAGATGEIAGPLLQQLADLLNGVEGLEINVCAIHNTFFEGNINIAGLIVGRDLINALKAFPDLGDEILIPNVMMRDGEDVFLDEMTLTQVNEEVGRPVVAIDRTPAAAAAFLLDQ